MGAGVATNLLGTGGYNTLAFGPGTPFAVESVGGLEDMPTIRVQDSPRPADIGYFKGQDLLDGRVITLGFGIHAVDQFDLATQKSLFQNAFLVSGDEIALYVYNSTRLINCRCRKRHFSYDAQRVARIEEALVELFASDPKLYDAYLQQAVVGLPVVLGGATFNALFNLAFGSSGAGGQVGVTNSGNFAARPVITIAGPVDNPIVANLSTGKSLALTISLSATDVLVIDMDARTIILNGSASRRSAMNSGSQWWDIPPGVNTLRFSNNGAYQAAANCTFAFRSAWV
jgi:hypothetical protein